jgi:hypothetical protein
MDLKRCISSAHTRLPTVRCDPDIIGIDGNNALIIDNPYPLPLELPGYTVLKLISGKQYVIIRCNLPVLEIFKRVAGRRQSLEHRAFYLLE